MTGIVTLPQKEVEIKGVKYLITALGATEGLEVITKLSSGDVDGKFIKAIILRSVTTEGIKRDEKWFDTHFARKYTAVQELYEAIIDFNLGEDPKDEGDMLGM